MKSAAFASFALLILSLPAQAVRQGKIADAGQFPAVGFLEPACTATLINANTVITANHCLFPGNISATAFVLKTSSGQEIRVAAKGMKILSSALPSEIALVRLKSSIKGISFPKFGSVDGQSSAVIAGYGEDATGTRSANLRYDTVKIDGSSNVNLGEGSGPMIRLSPLRTGGAITCSGDSGGPLLSNTGELIGIASFGYSNAPGYEWANDDGKCKLTERAYYVPVADFLAWIEKNASAPDSSFND